MPQWELTGDFGDRYCDRDTAPGEIIRKHEDSLRHGQTGYTVAPSPVRPLVVAGQFGNLAITEDALAHYRDLTGRHYGVHDTNALLELALDARAGLWCADTATEQREITGEAEALEFRFTVRAGVWVLLSLDSPEARRARVAACSPAPRAPDPDRDLPEDPFETPQTRKPQPRANDDSGGEDESLTTGDETDGNE
jgi:hypothetical protein